VREATLFDEDRACCLICHRPGGTWDLADEDDPTVVAGNWMPTGLCDHCNPGTIKAYLTTLGIEVDD
jgi:hypothetical protein